YLLVHEPPVRASCSSSRPRCSHVRGRQRMIRGFVRRQLITAYVESITPILTVDIDPHRDESVLGRAVHGTVRTGPEQTVRGPFPSGIDVADACTLRPRGRRPGHVAAPAEAISFGPPREGACRGDEEEVVGNRHILGPKRAPRGTEADIELDARPGGVHD